MCFGTSPPDNRQVDITLFGASGYDEQRDVYLHLPILETNTAFAGDYRTAAEVAAQAEESRRYMREHGMADPVLRLRR